MTEKSCTNCINFEPAANAKCCGCFTTVGDFAKFVSKFADVRECSTCANAGNGESPYVLESCNPCFEYSHWEVINDPLTSAKESDKLRYAVARLTDTCHQASVKAGWWTDLTTGQRINTYEVEYLIPAKLMLCVSELAEAMEGHRKNLMDDKLPHRKMIEVELADALIRICDLAEAMKLDLAGAVVEKLEFNASRADHKPENRVKDNGKAY